jgi:hypothetical protein
MIKVDGITTVRDDALVDDVEHLEKGCFLRNILRQVGLHATARLAVLLAPDFESEVHVGTGWVLELLVVGRGAPDV